MSKVYEAKNGLVLGDLHTSGILLADDIALVSTLPNSLQNMSNIVKKYVASSL